MASAQEKQPVVLAKPVSLGERSVAALALLVSAALIYGALALAAILPVPVSVESLARAQTIGHSKVVVAGYYITQHFMSMGGVQLPPYVFAAGPEKNAAGVRVSPELPDVRAGKVVAVIDTATGDGSDASPFAVHTIARWDSFVTGVIVGALIAVGFAFWLAGTAVALVRRRV